MLRTSPINKIPNKHIYSIYLSGNIKQKFDFKNLLPWPESIWKALRMQWRLSR